MNPHDLGVPHSSWRPNQYETYRHLHDSPSRFVFVEAPTGVGKSSIATALGHDSKVMVLVATLGLIDQYEREYHFSAIRGRQYYPCADLDKIDAWAPDTPTAFDCHHSKMSDCEFRDFCPYLQARLNAEHSQRVAMTYKYAAMARWPKERTGILVCDEGHAAAEEILACTAFSITPYHTRRFNVPPPREYFTWRVQEMVNDTLQERILDYLNRILRYTAHYQRYADKSPLNAAGYRLHLSIARQINTFNAHDAWFLDASPSVFTLKPLDARPVGGRIWENKSKVIFMSATIGDPEPLAYELGIDSWDFTSTPHLIPPEKRPVHVIFTDKMTKKNRDANPGLYRAQAASIAHFISTEIPSDWRGLILTTSYFKIDQLRQHLSHSAVADRIWSAPERCKSVSERILAFLQNPSSGIIAIDTIQGWGHGLDLRGDLGRFIIVAGVPHSNPSDPFDRARVQREGGMRYARWTAYNSVVQACGRVTRGIKMNGDYLLNVAALADGSCVTPSARRYYADWFKEAFV